MNVTDNLWMLIASALVFVMTPGLAFFYGGLVPARNAINTLKMSFICMSVIPLIWVIIGFSFAFSKGNALIGGLSWIGLSHINPQSIVAGSKISSYTYMIFQMMFAIISPALISGAMVGRIRFKPYVLFIILWSLLIYSPIAHWVWSANGWLNKLGAIDFAGGTVVHINAGVAGLVATIVLGPRIQFIGTHEPPHSIPLVLLGCILLWFGWFGFNAGSSFAANNIAVLAFINSVLSPAAAIFMWVLLCWLKKQPSSLVGSAFAAVVGLVAITPAAGYVTPMSAILIGAITSGVCYFILIYKNKLFSHRIDDSLDVFIGHGIGGIVGSLLTGIFATKAINSAGANGLLYGNPKQFLIQIIAVTAVVLVSAIGTAIILLILKLFINLRPSPQDEKKGIDIIEHGESAYSGKD